MGIWIKVGGRYEKPGTKGSAHFLEHLLFKGSSKYTCSQIKERIEGVGGALNGFTSEEFTCYLAKLPCRHSEEALDILSDMVLRPLLTEEDIAKERSVILEEIKMYKDLPQSYVHELLDELVWPGQPLGLSIAGSFESVGRISRQDLIAFKTEFYNASNIVVSAAGAVKHASMLKQVKKIFSGFKNEEPNAYLAADDAQLTPRINILDKPCEQTHLAMGFHAFPRDHALRHAVALLHIILGANMSSRLFNEVREKRALAYEIGTQVKRFNDTGLFMIHAGIDNCKVLETLPLIMEELAKIATAPVTVDEFRRAKEFYLGQLALAFEDTMDQMLWMGESVSALDKVYTLKDITRELKKVTRGQIQEAAGRIFKKENLSLALIGPLQENRGAIEGMFKT